MARGKIKLKIRKTVGKGEAKIEGVGATVGEERKGRHPQNC
jgi:hypothetical protein